MDQSSAYAVVTGASGGIGREMALMLSARGKPLILVGRNSQRLEAVKAELPGALAGQTLVLPCDLSEPGAAQNLHARCAETGLVVDMLINNAGSGLFGKAIELDSQAVEAMINLNITALTNLCALFGRDMRDRGSGDILNVGSFAGLNATPYFASYAATKSYVLNFSLALRAELAPAGINVSCLLPGYVRTEFDANAGIDSERYRDFSTANSMDAARVARIGLDSLKHRRAWVIAGARNRFAAGLFGLLPRALPPKLMMKVLDRLA